jgi:hypothetical protein
MIGRAPMMAPPAYAPSYPSGSYPAPQFSSQPATWPAGNAGWQPQAPFNPAQAQQPSRPIFRAKGDDEAAVPRESIEPLRLPSPDQLGIASPSGAAGTTDWTAVHQQLDRLGALCVHLEKVEGGCRFTCLLPTAQPERTHRVEAVASSEAEAVRLALDKCAEWTGGR